MNTPRLYDIDSWKEGVEYGVFCDPDGYGVGLDLLFNVVDAFVKPSDIDVLRKNVRHIRWYGESQ